MKTKSFLIICISLLIILLCTRHVFAESSSIICTNSSCNKELVIKYPDNVVPINCDYSSSYKHIIDSILVLYEDTYYIFCVYNYGEHYTEKLYIDSEGRLYYSNIAYNVDYFSYDSSSQKWSHAGWYGGSYNNGSIDFAKTVWNNCKFISTSSDIYTDNSYNKVFFHQSPLGLTETLVEETEKAQILEQIKTMIVGFLKYLIALVILVIAFWKGWQFLLTQLRKA